MTLLVWKLNRNAQIPTYRLEIIFYFDVGLSNIYITSATLRYPCSNNNTSSAVNIRCSATLTGITGFSQARTAHSPTMNVRDSRSGASCTSRITRRGSMESTCLTNASIHHSSFQWIGIYKRYCHHQPFSCKCDYSLFPSCRASQWDPYSRCVIKVSARRSDRFSWRRSTDVDVSGGCSGKQAVSNADWTKNSNGRELRRDVQLWWEADDWRSSIEGLWERRGGASKGDSAVVALSVHSLERGTARPLCARLRNA